MNTDRIFFIGNPWPEGHPIEIFNWSNEVRGGIAWFHFHLETADYDSERSIEKEPEEGQSEWESADSWGNFHNCILSSTKWNRGGFPVCPVAQYEPAMLNGLELRVDPAPDKIELDKFAMYIYLLGHDTVGDHTIRFRKSVEPGCFDIDWRGKIALRYMDDTDFIYDFSAELTRVPFPSL